MDTELLVENRLDDGRKLLVQLTRGNFDVTIAVWVKTSEEGLWHFYIASNCLEPGMVGDAYRTVYASLTKIPDSSISLSDIKLIPDSNPIALDAVKIRDRSPVRLPNRHFGKRLGNLAIEEAYIYPRLVGPMSAVEVMQTVTGLMTRTGAIQPSIISLRDGSALSAIPVGLEMPHPGSVQVVLLDLATNNKRIVLADDVVNIQ
jgi:hypothetical protein